MRKEVVWPVFLAIILGVVIYSQRQLREMADDPSKMSHLPFGEEPSSEPSEDLKATESPPQNVQQTETSASPLPASETPPILKEAFARAQEAFHKKAELAAASAKDMHHTPELVILAAQEFGAVVELDAAHPEASAAFESFYQTCARDEEVISVIRVQCLQRYVLRQKESEREAILSQFPEAIVRLYRAL